MRNWFNNLFIGRQGMDELSKAMFWWGLAGLLLSGLTVSLLNGVLASLLSWLGLLLIILCFVRAFSRQLPRRELENTAYLAWVDKKRRQWEGKKDRFRQRKDFKFFKCPGCGTTDISAGQLIDRTGVLLGLPFPAGKHLDALSAQAEKKDFYTFLKSLIEE